MLRALPDRLPRPIPEDVAAAVLSATRAAVLTAALVLIPGSLPGDGAAPVAGSGDIRLIGGADSAPDSLLLQTGGELLKEPGDAGVGNPVQRLEGAVGPADGAFGNPDLVRRDMEQVSGPAEDQEPVSRTEPGRQLRGDPGDAVSSQQGRHPGS